MILKCLIGEGLIGLSLDMKEVEIMEAMESVRASLIDSGLKIVKSSVEHRFMDQ